MLRYAMGAAGALLCLCVQANTLGIVTSGQGAAYDEFVETVRTELKSVPGLKIQLLAPGAEGAAARLPDDTFMVLAVGLAELMDEHQELTSKALMRVLKWSQAYERMNILLEQVNALAETIEEAVLKNV